MQLSPNLFGEKCFNTSARVASLSQSPEMISKNLMTKRRKKTKRRSVRPAKLRKSSNSVKLGRRVRLSNNSSSRSRTQPS